MSTLTPRFKVQKRNSRYRVLRLDGYTDGRPSWVQHSLLRYWTREEAETVRDALIVDARPRANP